MDEPIDPASLETAEQFHARLRAATGPDGRLPVAVEEMPGWDIYPYEIDSLRLKPLRPLGDEEPPRFGEDPVTCWCANEPDPTVDSRLVWRSERWRLVLADDMRLPVALNLSPVSHCDLTDVPDELAAEMGRLVVAVSAAVEELPSVGRVQLAKYGDGGAHLHLFFLARPARHLQFRGSPLIDWAENLPPVPAAVLRRNATYVGQRLAARFGGRSVDLTA